MLLKSVGPEVYRRSSHGLALGGRTTGDRGAAEDPLWPRTDIEYGQFSLGHFGPHLDASAISHPHLEGVD